MSDLDSLGSVQGSPLRLVRYDTAARGVSVEDRERRLSAELESRISSQLGQIRQRLARVGGQSAEGADASPGRILDVLA
jgi:hypothetical protein